MYTILCASDVRSGHGEVRSPIIGWGFAVTLCNGWPATIYIYLGIKMVTIRTKIRLCRYVSHNKYWPDLTWPDLTWLPTVLRRKFDNRSNLVVSLWPDLTLYRSEILHIYALVFIWSYTKFRVPIATRFRVITEKPKGMPSPPGGLKGHVENLTSGHGHDLIRKGNIAYQLMRMVVMNTAIIIYI